MSHRMTFHQVGCAFIVVLLVIAAGCGGGSVAVEGAGISIRLPEGWKQGDAKASGGYVEKSGAMFFFADASADNPSGEVIVFDLQGDSLAAFVDQLIADSEKMAGIQMSMLKAIGKAAGANNEQEIKAAEEAAKMVVKSKTPMTVNGREAIEVVTEAERSTVTLYIENDRKVISVTFGAEKADFPKYEAAFKAALATASVR